MCLSYKIHSESIDLLSRIIHTFILRFNYFYPNCIVPKFHFLIHIPRNIMMFGPARQQWCFRFELAHSYFKKFVPVVHNLKNMAKTSYYRHQARLYSKLITYPGIPSKTFLYPGDNITSGMTVLLDNFPHKQLFYTFINENERSTCHMFRTSKIEIHGTFYQVNTLF